MPATDKPLAGIRILDFTRVLSGPFATALLADVGAEVIKVEPPGGDDYRHIGPFRDGESGLFALLNRNKRSIVLDLKAPEGVAVARRLAELSDVAIENFRPGVADRLGIGYAGLKAANPGLVYVSVSGFGQGGPLAGQPAYDIVVQAMTGLMAATGAPDGPPVMVGESIADLVTGLFASWAVLVALLERSRTGRGQYVDVAMYDCALSLLPMRIASLLATGTAPGRVGNRHPVSAPFGSFEAADGAIVIAVANNRLFDRLAALIGRPDLPSDERFASDEARGRHEPALRAIIEGWTRSQPAADAVARLAAEGIPAALISGVEAALSSPQAEHRQILAATDHPRLGPGSVLEQPVHFSAHRRGSALPAPALGQHGEEILRTVLGLEREKAGR